VSLGDDPETFGSHRFGSVPVPDVVGSTLGTGPLPIGEREVIVLMATFGAELRRREEPVYLDETFAVPQSFIFRLAQKLSECGIQP